MGWNSGNEIFDPVAQTLIDLEVTDAVKSKVLYVLMDALQENDWDTEDESLERFKNDPAIVQIFHQHGIDTEEEDWEEHNVYYAPDKFGLTIVAEVDWRGDYEFDKLVVFQDAQSNLYYGHDSCPRPFENFNSVDCLTKVTNVYSIFGVVAELLENDLYSPTKAVDFLDRLMKNYHSPEYL